MLTVEDRLALIELVARYNHAIDHHEPDAWADVFTDDGELVANGTSRARGRQALFDYVESRRQAGTPRLRHWVTNHIIDGDGDQARIRLYVMAFSIADGLGAPYVMGEYDDEAVKISGSWKFRVRRMTVVAGASATGK